MIPWLCDSVEAEGDLEKDEEPKVGNVDGWGKQRAPGNRWAEEERAGAAREGNSPGCRGSRAGSWQRGQGVR